jgi:hypothetical protein
MKMIISNLKIEEKRRKIDINLSDFHKIEERNDYVIVLLFYSIFIIFNNDFGCRKISIISRTENDKIDHFIVINNNNHNNKIFTFSLVSYL